MNEDKLRDEEKAPEKMKELDNQNLEDVSGGVKRHPRPDPLGIVPDDGKKKIKRFQ